MQFVYHLSLDYSFDVFMRVAYHVQAFFTFLFIKGRILWVFRACCVLRRAALSYFLIYKRLHSSHRSSNFVRFESRSLASTDSIVPFLTMVKL